MICDLFDIPVIFDTDVNGAAMGEWRWGKAQGLQTFLYLTVGTGIGGGAYVEGKLLHGLIHLYADVYSERYDFFFLS
jgi:fructokinase